MLNNKFPNRRLISMARLILDKEWEILMEVREKGQPAYSARSTGFSYKGSYYLLTGQVQYGEEITIGQKDCGC